MLSAHSISTPRLLSISCALLVGALVGCKKTPSPPDRTTSNAADVATAHDDATAVAADTGVAPTDTGVAPVDTGVGGALTLRIVNAASRAVPFFTNPDINEMIHTRKLRSRRSREDGGRDSDPVKFFPVGQMPMCADDGGAGYGGLGQPERRELAPGEAIEYVWDGLERREVLDRQRGVCLEVGPPQPGRYRFEIDQPRRTLRCDDVEFSYPLREGAPRVLEIRCRIRTSSDDHSSDEG
ncbi:MAG: hypothetical protein JNK05_15095 [Myxococcales bacterium]|nr:hypothetical protein [Myxococcales bacterium]